MDRKPIDPAWFGAGAWSRLTTQVVFPANFIGSMGFAA
jgi:hypothetical protein